MFVQRLLSGIVLIAIMLATIITGGWVLMLMLGFVATVGVFELLRIFKLHNTIAGYIAYVGTIALYLALFFDFPGVVSALPVAVFLLLMIYYVFSFPKHMGEMIFSAFAAFIYVAWMLSYIYRLRVASDGKYLVWLIFIASWGSDTCAYCVGMLCKTIIKKTHQMTPKLSPKKSIEGGIGGLVGAGLLGLIYGLIFAEKMTVFGSYALLACILMAVFGGALSMIGDLAASAVKRNHDIKDYGHLIPGHGGIMDRFDSILFAAPATYYVAMIVVYFLGK